MMDVKPKDLRDIDISIEFRGYSRDEVNDLLERAAATIEGLSERVRVLSERLAAAQNDPARVAAPAPAPTETPAKTLELAQRTLEMAQKAADEELARARESASTLVRDAEIRASSMIGDAEAEARRRTETERQRVSDELTHLTTRREQLRGDVDTLDRFESDYRDRLVRAIEADLAVVKGRGTAAPSAVPELASLTMDSDMPPAPPVAAAAAPSTGESTVMIEQAPAATTDIVEAVSIDDSGDADTSEESREPVPATVGSSEVFAAEQRGADRTLPDDAFFTSLREAVRDDAPLEPGEERFFEEHAKDGGPTIRDVFRRRK
jgi:cell division septum initiation protein DivIVA